MGSVVFSSFTVFFNLSIFHSTFITQTHSLNHPRSPRRRPAPPSPPLFTSYLLPAARIFQPFLNKVRSRGGGGGEVDGQAPRPQKCSTATNHPAERGQALVPGRVLRVCASWVQWAGLISTNGMGDLGDPSKIPLPSSAMAKAAVCALCLSLSLSLGQTLWGRERRGGVGVSLQGPHTKARKSSGREPALSRALALAQLESAVALV